MRFRIASLWRSKIRVRFGRPIEPNGFRRDKADYVRFTDRLIAAVRELGGQDKPALQSP